MIPTNEPCPRCARVGFMGCTGCAACGWMHGQSLPMGETSSPSTGKLIVILAGIGLAGLVIFGLAGTLSSDRSERGRDYYRRRHARRRS